MDETRASSATEPEPAAVGVVGAGMIGTSWAIAFARGGCAVRLHDPTPGALDAAAFRLDAQLALLESNDLLGGADASAVRDRVALERALAPALDGVVHVQENAPEALETKRRVFAELDAASPPSATIASSSSALLPSAFVDGLPGRRRCLVAHPLNPPHLVPAVEIVPAPDTEPDAIRRCAALMRRVGQSPIVLSREIEGFVMNRLQGALLEEAFRLIDSDVVSASDLDVALKDGLGLRWSFMGPVETIDLNAPGGVADFVERYAGAYRSIAAAAGPPVRWEGELAGRLERERRAALPADELAERRDWRDRRLMALAVHRRAAAADDEAGAGVAPTAT